MSERPGAPVLQIINGYDAAGFVITNTRYDGAVIVLPNRTLSWPVTRLGDASLDNLAPILTASPKVELLVVGTGRTIALFDPNLRRALKGHGIVVEAMDTGAAARVYAVCLSEDRRVAAALLPPG